MAKKDEMIEEVETEEVSPAKSGILPLDMNLYREDLNALVAKVNELVEAVNNSKAV